MRPSEFFAAVPFKPEQLGIYVEPDPTTGQVTPEALDADAFAQTLTASFVEAARVDYEELTGRSEIPVATDTAENRKLLAVFRLYLVAAVQRTKKEQMSLDVVKIHNPDVQQNVAFNLDLVRVIGRAERGTRQAARKLYRGSTWLNKLVGRA